MEFPYARFSTALLLAAVSFSARASGAAETACSTWTVSTVDKNVLDADSYETATWISLDAAGSPSVLYSRGPEGGDAWRFRSATEESGAWHLRKLPTDQATADLSVAVDSRGRRHLSWRSGGFFGTGVLRYALIDGGTWHEEIVDPTPGGTGDTAIAVDRDDNPHIVYAPELAGLPMRHAWWDGASWSQENVLPQGAGVLSPSLALDSSGEPHVAYAASGGSEVHHAFRSGGAWTVEVIDVVAPNQSLEISLALDSADQPHVAYDELFNVGMHYATKTGSAWTSELVDAGQQWDPSLALDADGTPHLVFYDAERGALVYATLSSSGWCVQTIDDRRNELTRIGRNPSLALGADGRAHVAYHDHRSGSPCQARYAVSDPSR